MMTTGSPNKAAERPKDAATLIIINYQREVPRILMGRRRPDQIFMPNKFVFPGGRLDRTDRFVTPAGQLEPDDLSKLLVDMKGRPSIERAQSLALTAIRETYEETGLLFAQPCQTGKKKAQTSSNSVWQKIFDSNLMPALNGLKFLARAITPPGRTRRYDTRFFCVDAKLITHREPPLDAELLDQDWFALDEIRMLDLPHITRAIVEDLDEWLQAGGNSSPLNQSVPYYYYANGSFERELITSSAKQA